MPLQSIRAHVAPQTLGKVTRLFNGTLHDILTELLKNARRASTTRVSLITLRNADGTTMLRILDDGHGMADPAKLLALGSSGWGDDIAAREDPAGMGVFSLAGHDIHVSSRTTAADIGWSVTVAAADWTSGNAVAVRACLRRPGTTFGFALSDDWLDRLPKTVAAVARYFPLPVILDNEVQERRDFLDGAVTLTDYRGVCIGVFHEPRHSATYDPVINFHGVTVAHPLPAIAEIDATSTWFARVHVTDCPALQLTLPARKEVVASAFLDELATAIRTAIYTAIARRGHHRLGFAHWSEAAALGVPLPEAD